MANNKIVKLPTAAEVNNTPTNAGKGGFVKHYRSIQEERLWTEGSTLEFKLYCKIRDDANWQANSWTYEGKQYSCLPGELITSVQSLVDKLYSKRDKITPRKVRVALHNLVKYGNIILETGYQTKIIFTDKKYWPWKPEHGGWVMVGNDWLYFGPGMEEITAYFKENKEKIKSLYSNNTIFDVNRNVKSFADLIGPEKPDNKGRPSGDDEKMSRDMSRDVSTIEEVQEVKEEEEGPSSELEKEKEEVTASPEMQIVNLYYSLKKEYHPNGPAVKITNEIAILKKCDNRTTMLDDGPTKVEEKIRGWFHNTNDKNYEWKKGADFPFATFCKQYHTITAMKKQRIFKDTCWECGTSIYKNEEHICKHYAICDNCNTCVTYYGAKRDAEVLAAHTCGEVRAAAKDPNDPDAHRRL